LVPAYIKVGNKVALKRIEEEWNRKPFKRPHAQAANPMIRTPMPEPRAGYFRRNPRRSAMP